MKLVSPLPHKRGRLEIIPLIDIMFFLLAAFMVVSIGKIHIKSLKVTLPTDVPAAQKETKEDFISLSIDADGQVQIDKELIPSRDALLAKLQTLYAVNKDQKFLISADKDTHHGDVLEVLGRLRAAGFQKIAFSTKSEHTSASRGSASAIPAPASSSVSESSAAPMASVSQPASTQTASVAPPAPVETATPATSTAPSTAPAAPGN